ncbi:hypothetical protein EHI8A_052540 [Entamoeba histolytica HM-1:IMSS-B]|uniref:Uncharacterized protein n=4 Tax=Entamoeba histolytica TaxID=5759 RepID=C4MAC6_ENTH1|nr:hypothetical protein, conserved [Entamoeba histolytica HM-1:IMSS]EAL45749.1 hypothetical protein, conserved [Entamoeba histolytica HM-1:IMSS]EMH78280.1 hypothetical protein EHI8A_052540 [Entamoeba histolytica HM-1:IMSS-B]ENY60996.1 hypothetical protein EHI7A_052800 [Entamoeba histolytica HM-1:IMSS-A]GAT98729.1 hypothetical protein conserved [Entamoeba histolytica]|eukprot:XP_651135.1 hypothetical protein, conserved [Entamoeba histolytica HM-1:IMSS]
MDFSESTEEEVVKEINPVPTHRLISTNTKEIPGILTMVVEDNYKKPLKKEISDDFLEIKDDVEIRCPKQIEKELYLMEKAGTGKEESEFEQHDIIRLKKLVEECSNKMPLNKIPLTDEVINDLYGPVNPILENGEEIEEEEEIKTRNVIENINTGVLSLDDIPGELDDVFNEFDIPKERKKEIKDFFDDLIENIILTISDKEGGVCSNTKLAKLLSSKLGFPYELLLQINKEVAGLMKSNLGVRLPHNSFSLNVIRDEKRRNKLYEMFLGDNVSNSIEVEQKPELDQPSFTYPSEEFEENLLERHSSNLVKRKKSEENNNVEVKKKLSPRSSSIIFPKNKMPFLSTQPIKPLANSDITPQLGKYQLDSHQLDSPFTQKMLENAVTPLQTETISKSVIKKQTHKTSMVDNNKKTGSLKKEKPITYEDETITQEDETITQEDKTITQEDETTRYEDGQQKEHTNTQINDGNETINKIIKKLERSKKEQHEDTSFNEEKQTNESDNSTDQQIDIPFIEERKSPPIDLTIDKKLFRDITQEFFGWNQNKVIDDIIANQLNSNNIKHGIRKTSHSIHKKLIEDSLNIKPQEYSKPPETESQGLLSPFGENVNNPPNQSLINNSENKTQKTTQISETKKKINHSVKKKVSELKKENKDSQTIQEKKTKEGIAKKIHLKKVNQQKEIDQPISESEIKPTKLLETKEAIGEECIDLTSTKKANNKKHKKTVKKKSTKTLIVGLSALQEDDKKKLIERLSQIKIIEPEQLRKVTEENKILDDARKKEQEEEQKKWNRLKIQFWDSIIYRNEEEKRRNNTVIKTRKDSNTEIRSGGDEKVLRYKDVEPKVDENDTKKTWDSSTKTGENNIPQQWEIKQLKSSEEKKMLPQEEYNPTLDDIPKIPEDDQTITEEDESTTLEDDYLKKQIKEELRIWEPKKLIQEQEEKRNNEVDKVELLKKDQIHVNEDQAITKNPTQPQGNIPNSLLTKPIQEEEMIIEQVGVSIPIQINEHINVDKKINIVEEKMRLENNTKENSEEIQKKELNKSNKLEEQNELLPNEIKPTEENDILLNKLKKLLDEKDITPQLKKPETQIQLNKPKQVEKDIIPNELRKMEEEKDKKQTSKVREEKEITLNELKQTVKEKDVKQKSQKTVENNIKPKQAIEKEITPNESRKIVEEENNVITKKQKGVEEGKESIPKSKEVIEEKGTKQNESRKMEEEKNNVVLNELKQVEEEETEGNVVVNEFKKLIEEKDIMSQPKKPEEEILQNESRKMEEENNVVLNDQQITEEINTSQLRKMEEEPKEVVIEEKDRKSESKQIVEEEKAITSNEPRKMEEEELKEKVKINTTLKKEYKNKQNILKTQEENVISEGKEIEHKIVHSDQEKELDKEVTLPKIIEVNKKIQSQVSQSQKEKKLKAPRSSDEIKRKTKIPKLSEKTIKLPANEIQNNTNEQKINQNGMKGISELISEGSTPDITKKGTDIEKEEIDNKQPKLLLSESLNKIKKDSKTRKESTTNENTSLEKDTNQPEIQIKKKKITKSSTKSIENSHNILKNYQVQHQRKITINPNQQPSLNISIINEQALRKPIETRKLSTGRVESGIYNIPNLNLEITGISNLSEGTTKDVVQPINPSQLQLLKINESSQENISSLRSSDNVQDIQKLHLDIQSTKNKYVTPKITKIITQQPSLEKQSLIKGQEKYTHFYPVTYEQPKLNIIKKRKLSIGRVESEVNVIDQKQLINLTDWHDIHKKRESDTKPPKISKTYQQNEIEKKVNKEDKDVKQLEIQKKRKRIGKLSTGRVESDVYSIGHQNIEKEQSVVTKPQPTVKVSLVSEQSITKPIKIRRLSTGRVESNINSIFPRITKVTRLSTGRVETSVHKLPSQPTIHTTHQIETKINKLSEIKSETQRKSIKEISQFPQNSVLNQVHVPINISVVNELQTHTPIRIRKLSSGRVESNIHNIQYQSTQLEPKISLNQNQQPTPRFSVINEQQTHKPIKGRLSIGRVKSDVHEVKPKLPNSLQQKRLHEKRISITTNINDDVTLQNGHLVYKSIAKTLKDQSTLKQTVESFKEEDKKKKSSEPLVHRKSLRHSKLYEFKK